MTRVHHRHIFLALVVLTLLLVISLSLAGCAKTGPRLSDAGLDSIQVGVPKFEDLKGVFGKERRPFSDLRRFGAFTLDIISLKPGVTDEETVPH